MRHETAHHGAEGAANNHAGQDHPAHGHAAHEERQTHGHRPHGPDAHGGHDKHDGHDPEMFRRKFWLSLALTSPVVLTSEMVMDWFGYTLDFPGIDWVGPVLGSLIFFYVGSPFLV